jgi:hypothetical protein
MANILLSFVGNQDPFSDKNNQPGSIVSLAEHLLQKEAVKEVVLLYTTQTQQGAQDTRDWLVSELKLPETAVLLRSVDEGLSLDPIDQLLAIQAVRAVVDELSVALATEDVFAFNASSGTPAMKSAWGILQASGYAPNSQVWQVRNPQELKPGQVRVFKTDVGGLKREFDLKILREQVANYDYGAALTTAKSLGLAQVKLKRLRALLEYGRCRLCLDFDKAFEIIKEMGDDYPEFVKEIKILSRWFVKQVPTQDQGRRQEAEKLARQAWLQEGYFKLLVHLKRQEYSDALVDVFRLLDNLPAYWVEYDLGIQTSSVSRDEYWKKLKKVDSGQLYQYLEKYKLPGKNQNLDLRGYFSRTILIAILTYYSDYEEICKVLQRLNIYCDQRNNFVHEFKGVSKFDDEQLLKRDLRELLSKIIPTIPKSPFDRLNLTVESLLQGL